MNTPQSHVKTLNSDNITVASMAQPYKHEKGIVTLAATALSASVGNKYFPDTNRATTSLTTLARELGVSRPTLVKYLKVLRQAWDITSGDSLNSNKYSPKPAVLAGLDSVWDNAGKGVPTRISSEAGVTPLIGSRRQRQVVEPHTDEDPKDWYVKGTMKYLDRFKDTELSPAEKLVLTGIFHHLDGAFVVSQLSYPSAAARGLSIHLALMLNLNNGWASATMEYFTDHLKLNSKAVTRLVGELVASGLWRVDQDRHTGQLVFTPTPFLLAQITAYYVTRRTKNADGTYSGERLDYVTKCHPRIGNLVGTHAVLLGVNDQIGTATTPTDNPLAPTPGTTWKGRTIKKNQVRAKAEANPETMYTENLSARDDDQLSRSQKDQSQDEPYVEHLGPAPRTVAPAPHPSVDQLPVGKAKSWNPSRITIDGTINPHDLTVGTVVPLRVTAYVDYADIPENQWRSISQSVRFTSDRFGVLDVPASAGFQVPNRPSMACYVFGTITHTLTRHDLDAITVNDEKRSIQLSGDVGHVTYTDATTRSVTTPLCPTVVEPQNAKPLSRWRTDNARRIPESV